jgi:hypothetical protein
MSHGTSLLDSCPDVFAEPRLNDIRRLATKDCLCKKVKINIEKIKFMNFLGNKMSLYNEMLTPMKFMLGTHEKL